MAAVALTAACGEGRGAAASREGRSEGGEAPRPPVVDPVDNYLAGIRAYNENNVENLLSTYAEEATWHMPGAGAPPVQGHKRIVRQGVVFKSNFPDSRFDVRRILLMGDTLAAQVVFRAVRRFDEQGGAIEPQSLGYEAIQLVETDRGYARRTVVQHDQAGIRRQMGLVSGGPPPVPAPSVKSPEIVREPAAAGWETAMAGLHGAWERGDFAAWSELVTEGFELLDHATGQRFDQAGAVRWLTDLERELDTVSFERHRTVAAGPWVAAFLEQRVDHRRPGGDDSRRISLFGAHVMRIEQGRVASLEIYRNQVEIMRETGRLSELAGEPPSAE